METASAGWADTGPGNQSACLVERAARGDQSAWDELVRRYSGMLWRVARGHRLSREDAADAVQITWLRLAEHIHQIRDPRRISGWLMTTVTRECIRLCPRRPAALPLDDVRLSAGERAQPEVLVEAADDRRLLLVAFNRLPATQRLLLEALTASPPSSYADVARELGVPKGSIGPTRQRALSRLRTEVAALLTGTAARHRISVAASMNQSATSLVPAEAAHGTPRDNM
jgi:RNA polymerase sigma factor (sigma-70 family)